MPIYFLVFSKLGSGLKIYIVDTGSSSGCDHAEDVSSWK